MQKGFVPVFILLAIVILASLTGVYFFGRQPAQTTPTPSPSQTPTQIPDPTAYWKTYSNEEGKYSIKYPPEWELLEDNPQVLLTRIYPYANKNIDIEFKSEVTITVIPTDLSIEEFVRKKIADGNITYHPFFIDRIEGKRTTNIPGVNVNDFVFVNKDGIIYMLILNKGSGEQISTATFDQILSTFRFMDVAGISPSSKISQEEALEKVRNLSEVKDYLTRVPAGRVEFSHEDEVSGAWVIHVYEIVRDHTATSNWYSVNKETGKITDNLGKEY